MVARDSESGDEVLKAAMAVIAGKYSPKNDSWLNLDADRIVYELKWADNVANVRIVEAALEALEENLKT